MIREDATPVVEALLSIIYAVDGIGKDAFIARVPEATDNPKTLAALATDGHPAGGDELET
jgi:hypothetical protein